MNFKEFDDLIHSEKEIVLESDVVLDDGEESEYLDGIRLDIDNLIIDGNGHTIDARGKARIFLISADVTIKNITLMNAFSHRTGAAIYNKGCNLTIINSKFFTNAVWDDEFSIGEIFSNRLVVEIWGGAIYNDQGRIDIDGSTFLANRANEGGAIYNDNGEITVKNSNFFDNFSEMYGGAILNVGGNLKIINSNVSGNTGEISGGAVYSACGDWCISGSVLCENSSSGGGAIHFRFGKLNIIKSNLSGNNANNNGGAVDTYKGKLIIEESTFSDNFARRNAGAINYDNAKETYISNSDFTGNTCQKSGGAIYNDYNKLTISNSTFKNNSCAEKGNTINSQGEIYAVNCEFNENGDDVISSYAKPKMEFIHCKFGNKKRKGKDRIKSFLLKIKSHLQ